MKVKELIEALQQCHPDADVEFCLNLEIDCGEVIAVEHEIEWLLDRGKINPVGRVFIHNNRNEFKHDKPLLNGNLFKT
ncbi:hypothetical protein [Brunnivagina elsteri]|uniref:Uncharacterized protein n=1 Tax=Brunnivagina elsteri CCALA 953 TaxID=987040 RepID=A0A2A2TN65_9CYAN|nr:hypothetical protein [Calothrix elsteri]PAX59794.1 hypothetical protein CK510_05300 [Calothrix elsteri CCALA 953]